MKQYVSLLLMFFVLIGCESQVANQNKWSENPPNPEELIELKKAYGVKNEQKPTTWEDFIEDLNRLLED